VDDETLRLPIRRKLADGSLPTDSIPRAIKSRQRTKAGRAGIPTIRAVLHTIERARAELLAVLLVAAKKKNKTKKNKKRTATRRAAEGDA
jgi:hypothetical protein